MSETIFISAAACSVFAQAAVAPHEFIQGASIATLLAAAVWYIARRLDKSNNDRITELKAGSDARLADMRDMNVDLKKENKECEDDRKKLWEAHRSLESSVRDCERDRDGIHEKLNELKEQISS